MRNIFLLVSISFLCSLQATFVGNPCSPYIFRSGFFSSKSQHLNMKIGYICEKICRGKYKDKFKTPDPARSYTTLTTNGGLITINFKNLIDIYAMIGSSDIRLNNITTTKKNLSWFTGVKAVLYKNKNLAIGIDSKYFTTNPSSDFFLLEKQVAPLVIDLFLKYEEMQGSLAASYSTSIFIPYLGITYLYSSLSPSPEKGLYKIPHTNILADYKTNPAIVKRWGIIIGTSILNCQKATLNLETRMFDQNAFNISGELRF